VNSLRPLVLFGLLAGLSAAQPPETTPRPPEAQIDKPGFHLSLLPKAFTKNPDLEMTVNTQVTPYGKGLPEASPEHPVYYIGHDSGYQQRGETIGEHPPPPSELQRHLIIALKNRGYLAADAAHPPSLVLFFYWGSHNTMDRETAGMFPEQQARQELERAMLVGGAAYRQKEADRMTLGPGPADHLGKEEYLTYQTQHDLYYALVSAYDFAALLKKERKLAWRTSMTVNASGVSMTETLPVLMASSAFYFGRETTEPIAVMRDLHRGTVRLGPLRILENGVGAVPAGKK
jgi:hypothetical protein